MTDQTPSLLEQVREAIAETKPLNICGGNSKSFMGREPTGETLDVSQHRGIVSYQPVELVITARAGTPITELRDALDEHNQMLSFEPPLFGGSATLGGTLACNQSGPGRPWWGSVRDMVLGTRLINGKGEHLRFGGQVMKNVAGYDVSRAQAGAMGTLGVITEVSLKVLPKPQYECTLVQSISAPDAIHLMNRLAGQPRPLTAACWLDGQLFLRLQGAEGAVKQTAAQWQGDVVDPDNAPWRDLREQQLDFFAGSEPLWRFSVKSTAPLETDDHHWLIDWGGSQRWIKTAISAREAERLARDAGGQANCFRHGDRHAEVFAAPDAAIKRLHQRLKSAFDPQQIFNPGRLYSWM